MVKKQWQKKEVTLRLMGKKNDWLSFARQQQAEFYRNVGHYITNLQIDIKEIDAEIENILWKQKMLIAMSRRDIRYLRGLKS